MLSVTKFPQGKPMILKKKDTQPGCLEEATRGFEPLMRVLQTLALPLGHVAMKILSPYGDKKL